jgi:4-hydroxy-tetrahydrodipicolinate reductase
MNIAILGYGKMGKAIDDIAKTRGHRVTLKISRNNLIELNPNNLNDVDVAIDFSTPESAFNNICTALKTNTPVVSGTTGWIKKINEVNKLCLNKKSAFLYASNFSLGVNLFFELNNKLANLMEPYNAYVANIQEIHHIHKLDAPSGTAISLAEQIISGNNNYASWSLHPKNNSELTIKAKRLGEVPGTHQVIYQSEIDSISIKHEAYNRHGFALGAVIAAEWLINKEGVFSMRDVLIDS